MGELIDLEVERLVRRPSDPWFDEGAAALDRVRDLYYDGQPLPVIAEAVKVFLHALAAAD